MRKPGLPKLTNQNMEDAPEAKWVDSVKSTVNVAVQEIEQVRSENQGIKLLENADVELVEVEVQVPDPWITVGVTAGAPAYLNGWAAESGCSFYKGPDGVVEVRISIDGGTAGLPAWVMPVGYRPVLAVYNNVMDPSGLGGAQQINIQGDGSVNITGTDIITGQFRYLSGDAAPIPLSCWPKMVKTKFKKVAAVMVANVSDGETTKGLPAGCVYPPVWEMSTMNGASQVKLLNIAGLPYNRKSRVSLLIFGG